MNRIPISGTVALTICLVIIAPLASSHHSFGMFDRDKNVTLEGTVRQFQWTNPHVVIWVDVNPEGGGEAALWGVELTSPGNLQRAGWTKRSLNPGDSVSITVYPLRSGNQGGAFRSAENRTTGVSLDYDYVRLSQPQDGTQ